MLFRSIINGPLLSNPIQSLTFLYNSGPLIIPDEFVYETIEELSKWPVLIRAAYTSGYVCAPLLIQPGCSWRAYSRFRFLIFFVKSPLKDLSSFEAKYLLDCQRDDNFFRMVRTLETGTMRTRAVASHALPINV